jgi:hypothetical protein
MYANSMRGLLVLLACSGCSSILGIDNFKLSDAGTTGDDATDGPSPDVPDSCLGPSGFAVCLNPPPMGKFTFDAASVPIDTSPGGTACLTAQPTGWVSQGQPDACFIAATLIEIDAPMRVTGGRPLVLVSTDAIRIPSNGSIDAAAHRGASAVPPASPSADCMAPSPPMENGGGNIGHGGGAGATFGTRGGPGGVGGAGQNQGGQPSAVIAVPTKLRAGCNGGFGGRGQGPVGPPGGLGGGAVYLVAKNEIILDGFINASGAAGQAGEFSSGGSGGGAGGMVMLHASMISGNGIIIANGGGGAGGSNVFTMANAGADPSPSSPTLPAAGGGGAGAPGGQGFAGASQAAPGQSAGANNTGGGGGGGGGGYIRLNMQVPPALQVSPPASIVP